MDHTKNWIGQAALAVFLLFLSGTALYTTTRAAIEVAVTNMLLAGGPGDIPEQ